MQLPPEWPDFSNRSRRSERMEGADVSDEALTGCFDAMERLSRVTGAGRVSLRGIRELVDEGVDELSVLDVGAGAGATAHSFVEWGRDAGVDVDVHGIDLLEPAVACATRRYGEVEGLSFADRDLFAIDGTNRFDIVHASLVLHHFHGDDARRALQKMAALSRLGVVINDLHRHPVHWLASKVLVPAVTSSSIAIHDGPVSVLRGFRRRELVELARRAELRSTTIEWQFPFRWLMVGRE